MPARDLEDLMSGEQEPINEHDDLAERLKQPGTPPMDLLKRPMTITNIATLLGREPRRVAGLLKDCPIIGYGGHTRNGPAPLYDLRTAIDFIATPKPSAIATWFRSQSTATLPPILSKAMWEAERVKMRVMEESGELWHTSDVQRVFGETAMTIKDAMLLWVEKLPGAQQMSTEQYDSFRRQVIDLQTEIHRILIELPREGSPTPLRSDIEKMVEESSPSENRKDDE